MMQTILRLGLALAGQVVGARMRSGPLIASLALSAAGGLVLLVGLGFLIAGGFLALARHYDTPLAAAIVGGGLCLLALVVFGSVALLRRRRRPPPLTAQGLLPVLAAAPAMRGDTAEVLAAFGRLVATAAPATVAAALAGLLVGLFAPRTAVRRPC